MRKEVVVALAACMLSCTTTKWPAKFTTGGSQSAPLDRDAPFAKCHLRNGQVVVLEDWHVDEASRSFVGTGIRYSVRREVLGRGKVAVPFDQILVVETNRPKTVVRANVVVMGVVTGLSLALTVYCVSNPKACFGSCPTFYVDGQLRAEGFSSSIARVLEETDVDALGVAREGPAPFALTMTNEALETHAVRSVRLLAVERGSSPRVFRAGDTYYRTAEPRPLLSCTSQQGDCTSALRAADAVAYSSPADPRDLAAREILELELPTSRSEEGLVVTARNTLLNTFVFYQLLAYMGRTAGERFATLERSGALGAAALRAFGNVLGVIEVEVQDESGEWQPAGEFHEVGPIALETQLIRLPPSQSDTRRVRLVLGQGSWRIDQVAMVEVASSVEPTALKPVSVTRGGAVDETALARIGGDDAYLMTYPGDEYVFHFELPEGNHELFLESRGYYYEWIRNEWLREEDAEAFEEALADPAQAMKKLAPAYKAIEPEMDRIFWGSRVGRGALP